MNGRATWGMLDVGSYWIWGHSGHEPPGEIKWHWKEFKEWPGKINIEKKKQEKEGRLKIK